MAEVTEGPPPFGGNIVEHSIVEEMQDSFLTYSMSVIMSRALPDVRDGLKPSQRRILVAMNDLNLGPRAQTKKCSKISGDTSGNYHPHGDAVIYPTLVRMAQGWNMRVPLLDGQGNFGSVDGDPPAAMRYTEVPRNPCQRRVCVESLPARPGLTRFTQPVILPAARLRAGQRRGGRHAVSRTCIH